MAAKYDNATKSTWRGWAWNQIEARTNCGGLVLALCGDSALDVGHAAKRGLQCVGIDLDKTKVEKFRQAGEVAIQDKIHRQIYALKPDAVILDMMGGITDQSFGPALPALIVCRGGFVWNGLRGRDFASRYKIDEASCVNVFRDGRYCTRETVGKHRGKLAWYALANISWQIIKYGYESLSPDRPNKPFPSRFLVPNEWYEHFADITKPSFYSYQSKDSKGLYYDSVAMDSLGMRFDNLASLCNGSARMQRSKRKAAAAKALLTMRKNLLQK